MPASDFKLLNVSASELHPGFMRECEVEGIKDSKVLLVQYNNEVRATSHLCTHYNLPLVKGVLTLDGRLTCPFHGSCFRVSTGEIEDGPGLDALHSFPVRFHNNDVIIKAEESKIKAGRRAPDMVQAATTDDSSADVVVVGGGSGGVGAVEGLRQFGFKGTITVLSKESYLPIDRTKLSKALITDADKILLRDADFYKNLGVKVHNATVVKSVDFDKHQVTTEKGDTYTYKKLILATGGTPRKLPIEGFKTLSNIFVLRTIDDVQEIMQAAGDKGGKKIVVVGSSFIGMEVANALEGKKHDVVVVGMEEVPMQRVVGKEIGATFQKLLEKKKVSFEMETTVESAEPSGSDSSKVGSVILKGGKKLDADLVILGVGVAPETSYLDSSLLQKDRSLLVDENFQVKGKEDVFAVGDIATYPYNNQNVRIEHFAVAQNSGRSVGEYIATGKTPREFVPVFWSALGVQLRYCGYGGDYDDIVIKGSLDENKFSAYFTKGQTVIAVATMQTDPVMAYARELIRAGKMPPKKEIEDGLDITKLKIPGV